MQPFWVSEVGLEEGVVMDRMIRSRITKGVRHNFAALLEDACYSSTALDKQPEEA